MTQNKINQEHRAYILWDILVDCAKRNTIITYGEAGKKTNIYHRVLKWPLGYIQNYCLNEKLPPLTILMVDAKTLVPGDGFIAWDIDDKNTGIKKVYEEKWNFENPFAYAKNEKDTHLTISDEILTNFDKPSKLEDIYRKINNRGMAQRYFKDALLEVYDWKCAYL